MRAQYLSPLEGFCRAHVGSADTPGGRSVGQGAEVHEGAQTAPGTPMI